MTTGVIDPYDIAIRVDLGEIQEADLPKVFSGNASGLAECKRYLYKLRSDRLLFANAALIDLMQKLRFASDPKTVKAAITECVRKAQDSVKNSLYDEWLNRNITEKDLTLHTVIPSTGTYKRVTYYVSAEKQFTAEDGINRNMEENVILRIKNKAHGSDIRPVKGWSRMISKDTFNKVSEQVRAINKINENILGVAERRKVEADILDNAIIPFMSKMWAIGVIGDILEMLGKALGGNL